MKSSTRKPHAGELKSIKKHARTLKLIGLGVKSSVKATGAALDVALGRKNKEESYHLLLKSTVDSFVAEAGQLKGGFMKAGQMLSIYGEHFLPPQINQALKSLQSDSQPVSLATMRKKLKRSLSPSLYKNITLDPKPLGAASLGQVYRAQMHGPAFHPREFALKIQYPGMARAISSDLAMLKRLLQVTRWLPDMQRFDDIYDEISAMLHREVDYHRELRHILLYRKLLIEDPVLKVPQVYEEYSSKTILFMELIRGRRIDDPRVAQISQLRRNRLALALIRLTFQEIFIWRTVQTDPHVGNFLVQLKEDGFPDDRLVLLDFGAVRRFPLSYIRPFRLLSLAALHHNQDQIIHYGTAMGFLRHDDTHEMQQLFVKILIKAVQPFSEIHAGPCDERGSYTQQDYHWSEDTLAEELSQLARSAVFSFKLRPPPPEAIFLDRKLVGTATLLKILGARLGPRTMALSFLDQAP